MALSGKKEHSMKQYRRRTVKKTNKKWFVFVCILIMFVNDPQLIRAGNFDLYCKEQLVSKKTESLLDLFLGMDDTKLHLVYELNGGTNSSANPIELDAADLPVLLDMPVREGYNFAGWYTDCNYNNRITEINRENAANMVLFAKWTKEVDCRYNVEMYAYQTKKQAVSGQKELTQCRYAFLDDLEIPGMPSTREKDYKNRRIDSFEQSLQGLCFTPELILITAYTEEQGEPGALMAFDRADGEYLATFRMKKDSHLGGIAFDGNHVWVCHSNVRTLEKIPYDVILDAAKSRPDGSVDVSSLAKEYRLKNSPSCITCYGGRIWVATHTRLFTSQMYSYSYDSVKDTLTPVSSYHIPSKVQGVAFDGSGSVYFSTSYGRNNSSYLKIYSSLLSLDKKPNAPEVKVEMPPCSEEVAVVDEDVYILFESASLKYFEGTDGRGASTAPIDKVLKVEMASIW